MATPSTMIIRGLRLMGDKRVGGTLSSDEQTAYLSDLNAMIDSWGLEPGLIYVLTQDSKALTASVGSYTIGAGAAFNTARPNRIVDPCFIRDSQGADTPIEIIDAVAYGRIVQKTIDGSYPRYLFYDHGYTTAFGTIYLYPEPQAGLTLYINSHKALQAFAAVGDTVVLPPGYQRAIEFNFAVEAAGGFTNVSPEVARIAHRSLAVIKNVNKRTPVMQVDLGIVGHGARGDILSG